MSREYVLEPVHRIVDLRIDYAREVNAQQLAAVTAPPGPALVIAGAGSGKTRTLTYRVAYLLEQGISPERILLLTFTNKAAREMMRRVTDLLGSERPSLWGGTFHSIGNRILRLYAGKLGYARDFTILDQEDARHLIATCVAESDIDPKATRFPKPEVLGSVFSLAVNRRRPVGEILAEQFDYFSHLLPAIEQMQQRYAERKRHSGSMDFDDLLALWLRLMEEQEDVREELQRRFQFILVDEYQDTNQLQGDLIDLLAARHKNVMAVGDDAQSIYGWRGANFRNILEFPRRYPKATVYRIETNYRSTPEILSLANAAIRANTQQFVKELAAARASGMKPVVVPCGDAGQQARFVAQRVLELREEGRALEHMAVLYRSHFHALELQLELTRRNIPFSITSGIRFFEQAHIKDVTAHLKFVLNPRDELSFKRIVQLLPGIGGKGAEKLWQGFDAKRPRQPNGEEPGEQGSGSGEAPAGTEPTGGKVRSLTQPVQAQIAATLQGMAKLAPKKSQVAWAQFTLKATFENYTSRREDLEQLAAFSEQFDTLQEFLTQLALLTNVEAEETDRANRDLERLRLSTVHQAKGLEFDVVFVIMLCEGMFPSNRSMETGEGEEEERRLMYVAVTRARDELYLSYPIIRAVGGGGDMMQRPSRFLGEIPDDLREEWALVQEAGYI